MDFSPATGAERFNIRRQRSQYTIRFVSIRARGDWITFSTFCFHWLAALSQEFCPARTNLLCLFSSSWCSRMATIPSVRTKSEYVPSDSRVTCPTFRSVLAPLLFIGLLHLTFLPNAHQLVVIVLSSWCTHARRRSLMSVAQHTVNIVPSNSRPHVPVASSTQPFDY